MCRSFALAAFLIFLFATLVGGRQAGRNHIGVFHRRSVVSATGSFNKEKHSHLLTAGSDVDITVNLFLPEPAISMDDLFAYFPMTVSKLVLHPANIKPPEMFRL
jgi:hypothetical protein